MDQVNFPFAEPTEQPVIPQTAEPPEPKRHPQDFYPTPDWVTVGFLKKYTLPKGITVDPAFGTGNIVISVDEFEKKIGRQQRLWSICDINGIQSPADTNGHQILNSNNKVDFLTTRADDFPGGVTSVITNPPFSLAQEFVLHAKKLWPHADVCYLLPIGFLASKRRVDMYKQVGEPDIYCLSKRPSFTSNGKTNSQEYAWFVWPGGDPRGTGKVGHIFG